jgi:RNA-directed DNA polymerase
MSAAATLAGAAPDLVPGWHSIPWRKVWRNVRRLQARIVKAVREGRWGKVRALVYLLTHSFSGRAAAILRVTTNQGASTPGVDGDCWDTPERKAAAFRKLRRHGYQPQPLRRVYLPKSSDPSKLRPLGIPTLTDRAMQALYLLGLDPIEETTADTNSYGFRSQRCCADALDQCYKVLSQRGSATWILEGDIKACFDRISHDWLLTHIPMDRVILRKWLQAGYLEKDAFFATTEGTPQGGIASPALANATLDGLEPLLRERFGATRPQRTRNKVHLVRYADDFIITGTSKELLRDEVQPLVAHFLKKRGLELSHEKTSITHIEGGFDFLGQNVRRFGTKLLLKAFPQERAAIPGQGRRHDPATRWTSHGRGTDRASQPADPRLGAVSPARVEQPQVGSRGSPDPQQAMALGATATPAQIRSLGEGEILRASGGQRRALSRHGHGQSRGPACGLAGPGWGHTHPATRENPRGGQSL